MIREISSNYLDDEFPEIRNAAAVTCCSLLASDPMFYQVRMSCFLSFWISVIIY